MTAVPLDFELPPAMTAADLSERLNAHMALQLGQATPFERVYYDSFDWRLYGKGLALVRSCTDGGSAWRLYELASGDDVARANTTGDCEAPAPFFANELPDEALAAALAELVPIRALLPLAHVVGQETVIRVVNNDIKTVARVAVEEGQSLPDKTPLPVVARVRPVRGYNRARDEVSERLAATPGLVPRPEDGMVLATTVAGHVPGDYSAAFNIRLDGAGRADEAARLIHRTLFEAMVRNEPGVRADIDSEFLHDFRVAIRRTRSALSQIKDVLPEQGVEQFKTEFGWLGQMTGPTRDLDVYLLTFDDLRDQLPAHLRDRLEPLREHLARRQRQEQAILVRALDTPRYRRLKQTWPAFLDAVPPPEDEPSNAAVPIAVLAAEQIWRAFRRTARDAAAITPDSPPEQVHELRKTAKKLRYLIEFYSSLYPAATLKELVGELKQLQDVLGEYQDLQVQIDSLEGYAAEMQTAGDVPAATLMAIGALTGQLYSRELEVREEMMPVLQRFARPKLRARFEAMLGGDPTPPDEEADAAGTAPIPDDRGEGTAQ